MKQLKLTFVLTILLSMVGLQAFAAWDTSTEVQVDDLYYYLDKDNYLAQVTYMPSVKYTGNITIPSTFNYQGNTYGVTSIGRQAFNRCSGLTSVTISNSVTSIGDYAFYGCSGLTSVTIPNSVTSIGYQAFQNCSGLTEVTIPNSVTSIDSYAFSGCSGLTSISVESGNEKYDSRDNCDAIIETASNTLIAGCKNTVIPNSVTSIGGYAFYGCSGLTSVDIPNSVTSIGSYAFSGTAWYDNQPDGLVYAGFVAYKYKGTMPENTTISIKEGTLGIGSSAFYDCNSLTSITIPNSVTEIGYQAFQNCSGLKSIEIPNSVTSIKNWTFNRCSGLTSITIPNSVTSIGSYAFSSCSGLTSVTIPNSVTSIGIYAFNGCSGLTSVTIPNSVTSIEDYAFYGCSGLTSITIPNSVTNIGDGAFYNCSGLTSIEIPNSVTSIGDGAFESCSVLTSIEIPNSVTSIGNRAFRNCSGLTSVKSEILVPFTFGSVAFSGISSNCVLAVPYGTKDAYIAKGWTTSVFKGGIKEFMPVVDGIYYYFNSNNKQATVTAGENKYSGNVIIPSSVTYNGETYSVTSIGETAFRDCSSLTSVTIPNSVTSIGNYAFQSCSGLTSVTIPNSVTSIGSSAFQGCSGLTSVTIPNSVTSIGIYAFRDCTGLKKVIVQDIAAWCGISFGSEDANPLYYAHHLYSDENAEITNLVIPNSVTSIGNYAFSGCSGLASVTIPNSVTNIGGGAFRECSGLTSIEIPNSVTSIGGNAFSGCSSLTSVTCKATSVPSTSSNVFYNIPQSEATLYVPNSALENYKTTAPWNGFGNIKPFDFINGSCGENVNFTLNLETGVLSITGTGAMTDYSYEERVPWYEDRSVIKSVVIDNGVTTIGNDMFYKCDSLDSVTIPNSVTSIGNYAFNGCTSLTSIEIPNSVTSIGVSVFYNCSDLTKVTLNSNTIVSKSYSSSSSIKNIFGEQVKEYILGNDVTIIGQYAFYNCKSLTSVTIPNSVTSIGQSAFSGCSGLTEVHITDLEAWCKIEFSGSYSNPLYYAHHLYLNGSEVKNLVIPNSVTEIGNNAFDGCSGLTSITIPNSVTSIGSRAFYGTDLKTLIVGTGVLSFGSNVFFDPNLLYSDANNPIKTIWLTNTPPQNYTVAMGDFNYVANNQYGNRSDVKEYKFLSSMFEVDGVRYVPVSPSERTCDVIDCVYDESASEVSINPTVSYRNVNMKVQNVQPYTFCQNTNIKKVSLDIDGSIGVCAFSGCNNLQTVVLGQNVTSIKDCSFSDCSKLEGIIIPDSVTSIGYSAFNGCTEMKSAVIGNGTKTIGQYAFNSCSSLSSVTIGKGTNSIGNYAFSGCTNLESISLGEGTETIYQYAFQNCSSLPSITIPGSVNSIGNYVFSGCTGLKTVIMEDRKTDGELKLGCNENNSLFVDCPLDSVYIGRNISYSTGSSYGYSPFYRNTSLRAVVITDKETEVSENEFYGCTNLQNVQIGDGVTSIGNWAFSGCSSLKNFSFGTQVKTIGKEAFSDCTAVTAISSKAQTPPTCGTQALDDINKWDCVLYVPKGHVADYQAADQWKDFFFIEEGDMPDFLRGDVNGDGVVNGTDIQAVINAIVEGEYDEKADVNEDDIVNGTDIQEVINIIVNAE